MRRLQHQMPGAIYQCPLLPRMATPQQKYTRWCLLADQSNCTVSKGFPALAAMRARSAPLYCQRAIEQQHSLERPVLEIAMRHRLKAHIGSQLLVDIEQ